MLDQSPTRARRSREGWAAGRSNRRAFLHGLLGSAGALALAGPVGATSQSGAGLTLALVGDIIFQRAALSSIGPQMTPLLQRLRSADVAYGNFESSGFALEGFPGKYRGAEGGPVVLSPPAAISELREMGFDLLSTANNHGADWGEAGVLHTIRSLQDAGFTVAGSGPSLMQARRYAIEESAGAKVALVSATASLAPEGRASNGVDGSPAKPGLHSLRLVSDEYPTGRASERDIDAMGDDGVRIEQSDRAALLEEIGDARAAADVVIFSLHAHQAPPAGPTHPSRYQIDIAHAAIEAGANIVVMHGPHQLRGIERYKGGAIFYSLGNFMVMLPEPSLNPHPMVIPPGSVFTQRGFFESVVATVVFEQGKIRRVELQPVELRQTGNLETHGTPRAVFGMAGENILARLHDLSLMLGTKLERSGDMGIVPFDGLVASDTSLN